MPFTEGPGVFDADFLGPLPGEFDRRITQRKLADRHFYQLFNKRPLAGAANGAGAATGATGDVNIMSFGRNVFEYHIKGAGQTIVCPVISANGLNIALDQATTEGVEITAGITALSPYAYVVGTDPAFFTRARFKVGDASGANPLLLGFRKAEAYQAAHSSYADIAGIGIVGTSNPNLIKTYTIVGGAAAVATDTTDTWADAATKTLEVYVSAAGVVTYKVNAGLGAGGAAPTVTVAYTATAGAVLVPFIYFLNAADLVDTLDLISWETGFQAAPGIGLG